MSDLLFKFIGLCLLTLGSSKVLALESYEQAPIYYSETTPNGPISRLIAQLDKNEIALDLSSEKAFLRSLLAALDIPEASQVLVFSKTSHQNARISPTTPRAVYFNEEIYLGWVQGGVVELASMSPNLGLVFHVLDHRTRDASFKVERTSSCLSCHAGSRVYDMPGVMVRSVFPDDSGFPMLSEGSFMTTHASPFDERWGGWYVTGKHGKALHMGNITLDKTENGWVLDRNEGANQTDLSDFFQTAPYLRADSDIVALMVLEHQTEMHNILNRAAYNMRIMMHRQAGLSRELDLESATGLTGSSLVVARSQTEKILRYLLFCDEIELPNGGIDGNPAFQDAFQRNAKTNRQGRSLKDFQLLDRLFKYRCSYMIYSSAFDALPMELKDMVFSRLLDILDGRDTTGQFEHLSESERGYIKDILMETKPDIARAWHH